MTVDNDRRQNAISRLTSNRDLDELGNDQGRTAPAAPALRARRCAVGDAVSKEYGEYGKWAVRIWNQTMLVGAEVTLIDDFGNKHETKTRSEAWLALDGSPLVMVEGRTGGYLLWRIWPRRICCC